MISFPSNTFGSLFYIFYKILHTLGTFTDHIFTKNTERKEEILISLVDFLRLPAAVYSEIAFRFSVNFFFYSKIRIEKR